MKTKDILYRAALLIATVIWGSAFVVMKNTVDDVPTAWLLVARFWGATVVLSCVFFKKLKKINFDYIKKGAVVGLMLFLAYYVQTVGLIYTTPGKNAFLTAVYCVLVPFFGWAVTKDRPDRNNIIAAFACIIGIGFVSLTEQLTMGIGDLLTLLCGVFYAVHILFLGSFTKERDPILLTIIQFFFVGCFSFVTALATEAPPAMPLPASTWLGLGYLCVFSTAIALLLQTVGQKGTPAAAASILLSLEAVFGVLFSVIFYHEPVTARMYIGFALIFAAVLISELKPLKKKSAA